MAAAVKQTDAVTAAVAQTGAQTRTFEALIR